MKTNLKLAPPPGDLGREALAAAIAAKMTADEALAENVRLVDELRSRIRAAEEAVEAAQGVVEAVREAAIRRVGDPSWPGPSATAREARAALADAEDFAATLRAGREAAKRARPDLESNVTIASIRLAAAIAAVVRDDPATRRLVQRYTEVLREMASVREALYYIDSKGAIPVDLKGWGSEPAHDLPSAAAPWRAAFEALARDANAPLPT
ncbi:MAG: hypothetical protein ABSC25_15940 [Roseiarcus sp.]|jgi:hypothetical protein